MKKRSFLAVAAAGALLLAGCTASPGGTNPSEGASGTAWPEPGKTITLHVGFAPGGVTDTFARQFAQALGTQLNTRVEVVNEAGAGTQLANASMLSQPADGYSMSLINLPTFMTFLYSGDPAPYADSAFLPIANLATVPNALIVRADSPYQTVQDVIDAAKTKTLNVGDNGGADDAIVLGGLEQLGGVKFNHVVYNGTSEKVQGLLSGDVALFSGAVGGVATQVQSGDFRILAQWTPQRTDLTKDIPTATEEGFPIVYQSLDGFSFAAGVPDAIRQKAEDAIKAISTNQTFIDQQTKNGIAMLFQPGTDFVKTWSDQEAFIKDAKAKFNP